MPFEYACVAISGKENGTWPPRNLCAQISPDLRHKIPEPREAAGLTTAQHIIGLLIEYIKSGWFS